MTGPPGLQAEAGVAVKSWTYGLPEFSPGFTVGGAASWTFPPRKC